MLLSQQLESENGTTVFYDRHHCHGVCCEILELSQGSDHVYPILVARITAFALYKFSGFDGHAMKSGAQHTANYSFAFY